MAGITGSVSHNRVHPVAHAGAEPLRINTTAAPGSNNPTPVMAMAVVWRTSGGLVPAGASAIDPSTQRANMPATNMASGGANGKMYVGDLRLKMLNPRSGRITATNKSARWSPARKHAQARAKVMLNHGNVSMVVAGKNPAKNAKNSNHHGSRILTPVNRSTNSKFHTCNARSGSVTQ